MTYLIFFQLLALVCSAAVAAPDSNALLNDAASSLGSGDLMHSYRIFEDIDASLAPAFRRKAIDGYVKVIFLLLPQSSVQKECDRLASSKDEVISNKTNYLCGLHFLENKLPYLAEKYVKNVAPKSQLFWPARILLAAIDLFQNRAELVPLHLKTRDLKNYQRLDLEGEFYLTRARGAAEEGRFEEALREMQTISSSSRFYLDAAAESAWLLFKLGRFEPAQIIIDAIRASYEGKKEVRGLSVSPTLYYRIRYLEAYMNLMEQRTEGATALFSDFKSDFEQFVSKAKTQLDVKKGLQIIKDQNAKWTDALAISDYVKNQLQLISLWSGPERSRLFEKQIVSMGALAKEAQRIGRYPNIFKGDLSGYPESLEKLRNGMWMEFAERYSSAIKNASHNLSAMSLKAELGRLEIVWLERAQGARTLDEIIDDYRREVHAIDEFTAQ